METGMISYL